MLLTVFVCSAEEKTDAGGHGFFTIHTDPEGAAFALWQMAGKTVTPTRDGDKNVTKPKTPFCWYELVGKNAEAQLKFYKPALNWGSIDQQMGPDMTYHMVCLKG